MFWALNPQQLLTSTRNYLWRYPAPELTSLFLQDIGANASAEEAEEDLATESNEVIDVVDAFGLEPAPPYLYDELESSKKKNKGKPREEQEIKTEYFKKLGGNNTHYLGAVAASKLTFRLEYLKKVQQKMKDDGASAEATKKFATAAQGWYNSNIKPDLEKFELFQHPADAEFEGMYVLSPAFWHLNYTTHDTPDP